MICRTIVTFVEILGFPARLPSVIRKQFPVVFFTGKRVPSPQIEGSEATHPCPQDSFPREGPLPFLVS